MEEEIIALKIQLELAIQKIDENREYTKYLSDMLDKTIGYIEFIQHGDYVTYKEYLEIKH